MIIPTVQQIESIVNSLKKLQEEKRKGQYGNRSINVTHQNVENFWPHKIKEFLSYGKEWLSEVGDFIEEVEDPKGGETWPDHIQNIIDDIIHKIAPMWEFIDGHGPVKLKNHEEIEQQLFLMNPNGLTWVIREFENLKYIVIEISQHQKSENILPQTNKTPQKQLENADLAGDQSEEEIGNDDDDTEKVTPNLERSLKESDIKGKTSGWTQGKVDDAIREYKKKNIRAFDGFIEDIKNSKPDAVKEAREIFGRNAVARAIGVKSMAMVSKSNVWKLMAKKLGLNAKIPSGLQTHKANRIGHKIAMEQAAEAQGDPVSDEVERNEAIDQVKGGISQIKELLSNKRKSEKPEIREEADRIFQQTEQVNDLLISALVNGETSPEKALENIKQFKEQIKDGLTNLINQKP